MKEVRHVVTLDGGRYTYGPEWDSSYASTGVTFSIDGERVFYPYSSVVSIRTTKSH